VRKEHGLRACKNRMLRRIFAPKREKIMGSWRKVHNQELIIGTPCQILG
jgi:hypothetical protein